jgi:hypothetical protein
MARKAERERGTIDMKIFEKMRDDARKNGIYI